jgi:hypothetical protein
VRGKCRLTPQTNKPFACQKSATLLEREKGDRLGCRYNFPQKPQHILPKSTEDPVKITLTVVQTFHD